MKPVASSVCVASVRRDGDDATAVFIGAHSEGFAGYPDCRPAFFEAFQQVINMGTHPDTHVGIEAPFAEWSKTDIVERGLELGALFEHTQSCYRDEAPACGTCDSCADRLQAFRNTGTRDPIPYAERPEYED